VAACVRAQDGDELYDKDDADARKHLNLIMGEDLGDTKKILRAVEEMSRRLSNLEDAVGASAE
jgi:hypothetical protein